MATYRRSDLLKQEDLEKRSMKKRMLTGGQAKLDKNKDNKIDAQDFKILKAEKAKGRGMGLQDEKVQPGKVMKAKMGVATDYKKYLKGLKKATDSVKKDKENKFIKRRMKLMGMPKLSKGGGYDSGNPGKLRDIVTKYSSRLKSQDRLTERDIDKAKEIIKNPRGKALNMTKRTIDILKSSKKMGGGMMQKPMGYSKGTMIKARGCKLGRTRPTKIT